MQSFDLQRVLEGEKALRSEAARQLKEVEKKLVSLRSPAVSLSSPMVAPPGSLTSLEAEKDQLQTQIKAHSAQVSNGTPQRYCMPTMLAAADPNQASLRPCQHWHASAFTECPASLQPLTQVAT